MLEFEIVKACKFYFIESTPGNTCGVEAFVRYLNSCFSCCS